MKKPTKSIPITKLTKKNALKFGRKRDYVRDGDEDGKILLTLKNKKTGRVVIVPSSHFLLDQFDENWMVVENLFKE